MIYLNGSKPSRGRHVSRIGRISFISGWTAEKLCSGKKLYTAACRFINHYPDFMAMTKSGRLILVEAKGDYLDSDDSKTKLKLGRRWQAQAGSNYRYFMVFKDKELGLDGAYTMDCFWDVIKNL